MTPAARIAAAIELDEQMAQTTRPADTVIRDYFRSRRYAGSTDRRDITERVYGLRRRHARLDWWCHAQTGSTSARGRVLADLALQDGQSAKQIEILFNEGQYAPPPLSEAEVEFILVLEGQPLTHADMPPPTAHELPEWLATALIQQWNGTFAVQMGALNQPAPVDLRVNSLKADCRRALKLLANDGIDAEPTPYSPVGLRLAGRPNLEQTTAFKGGFIEIQDEGSQLAALLVDAGPDDTVIDLCAGAGGKSLAIAAQRGDHGKVIACDIDAKRLERIGPRAKRAGARSIETRTVRPGDDPAFAAMAGTADRVLIDAPCTGTGTWRRRPEARWQLTPEQLAEKSATQSALLKLAADLVAPGGRLVYVTCSILTAENEVQIEEFLSTTPDFTTLPIQPIWAATIDGPCPADGPHLNLTPAQHATDGFFVAVMERTGG